MSLTFVDFFSGAGGMRMGFERAGFTCLGFCEYDKYARQTYKAIFESESKGEWENHDIRTVNPADVPRADLWAYGFPCQGISVAGLQKGVGKGAEDPQADERSNLFFQIIRLLSGLAEEDRPTWLVCENVKNLLSIDRGYGFARILYSLDEMGYDSEWQLFNTKHSYTVGGKTINGVPQNRERVYIVSRLRRRGGRKVFPVPRANGQDTAKLQELTRGEPQFHRVYHEKGVAPTLEISITKTGRIATDIIRVGGIWGEHQAGSVFDTRGVSPTIKTCSDGGSEPYIVQGNAENRGG